MNSVNRVSSIITKTLWSLAIVFEVAIVFVSTSSYADNSSSRFTLVCNLTRSDTTWTAYGGGVFKRNPTETTTSTRTLSFKIHGPVAEFFDFENQSWN